jgi:hypothetical protein
MFTDFSKVWTPARFLFVGGVMLTLIGFTGAIGVLGLVSSAVVFHPPYWIHWVHLSAGIANIAVATTGTGRLQRAIAFVPAVLGTALGVAGFVIREADPSDQITHFSVGAMALLALWSSRSRRR